MRSDGDHGSRGDAPTAVSAPEMKPNAGATRRAARPNAAPTPAAVPSTDIAPGVPGFTRPNVVTRNVERPHAFPISLATVSLPPAMSAAAKATSAIGAYGVVTAATAAMTATPQFAIALPAPRRPPRSSAMPSSDFRFSPSRDAIDAARNAAKRRIH